MKEGTMNSINHCRKLWGWGIVIKLALALAVVITLADLSFDRMNVSAQAGVPEDFASNIFLTGQGNSSVLSIPISSDYASLTYPLADPVGNHDGPEGVVGSDACSALGWTVDPDDYERDLTVQILSDGSPVITTTANLLREDIPPEICPGGTCVFQSTPPVWGATLRER
jgi:hypothetical protein